ncbi:MAG: HlyD family efflux transporter periplasmic adaptor subunit, partial [Woeseia sp.]
DAVRASLAGARDDVEFRRVEYRRARDVHAQNLAAADSVDRAKAALDSAQAQRDVYEAQLAELLAGTTVEELAQAEQRLLQAKASLQLLATDLARHRLTAPQDGIVDSLLIEVGERPQPAQPLVVLLTGAQPYARIYVPEEQRIHVRPGMAARVHVDGLDDIIDGRVRWVASDAAFTPYFALTQHDRGRLTYPAKVDLDYEGPRLPDGVPVEVELDLPAASDGRD